MALATAVLVVGGLAACGDDDDTPTTTTESTTTTTTGATTTSESTTTAESTTTTESSMTTIATVVAWIQANIDRLYAEAPPSPNLTGPNQLVCTDSGPIEVGGVFACALRAQTRPGVELDAGSMVVYVLDASGRAAVTGGTDVPGSTETLMRSYENVPKGLYCRDLLDFNDSSLYPFNDGFFWSLVYWSLEGEPDRMDADKDGIPCETVYSPDDIESVLAGGWHR